MRARFGQLSAVAGLLLITGAILLASACTADRERLGGTSLTEPPPLPDVSGSYEAVHLIVERGGHATELIGQPDTRLSLTLNADGSAHGQLKIGTDPELRIKQALVGTWRLHIPGFVTFDFSEPSIIEQTSFTVVPDGLVGEWSGKGVRLRIELRRIS